MPQSEAAATQLAKEIDEQIEEIGEHGKQYDVGVYYGLCSCHYYNELPLEGNYGKTVDDHCRACGIPLGFKRKGLLHR